MRIRIAFLLLLAPLAPQAHADALYAGTLGKHPIHLVLEGYSDGVAIGTYVYDRHDTPIALHGQVAGRVADIVERDGERDVAALHLEAKDDEWTELTGTWTPAAGGASLPVRLRRQASMDRYRPHAGEPVELLQGASTPEHYFTVRFAAGQGLTGTRAIAVSVYRKRTDELLQTLEVDADPRGFSGVETGDFNFDGVLDFSLFEASYAGPNTSSLYFLRDPATGTYARSRIEGTSLEFDATAQLVHEHNQCCMGSSHVNATYRVVGDALELVSKRCLRMDEVAEDLVEVPCDE